MGGILKVVLWTVLAAVVAIAIAVGFGLFRLSQIFPDAEEGRTLAEQFETELGASHPAFTVETRAEPSFGEVSVTLTPVTGELSDPEVTEVLVTSRTWCSSTLTRAGPSRAGSRVVGAAPPW